MMDLAWFDGVGLATSHYLQQWGYSLWHIHVINAMTINIEHTFKIYELPKYIFNLRAMLDI